MKTYINKEDKRVVFVVPLEATTQDGYIVMNDGVIGWESKESFDKLYEEEPNYSETVIDRGLSKILNSLFMANKNIDDKNNMTYKTPTDEEIKLSEKDPDIDPVLDKNVESMLDSAYTESNNKTMSTDVALLLNIESFQSYKEAITYYYKNCKGNFEAAATPLLIYLAKEHSPMTKAIVESDKAELVEGVKSVVNESFIKN